MLRGRYSPFNLTAFNQKLDHGLFLGLSDDDHTQYPLVDLTRGFAVDGDAELNIRAITGNLQYAGIKLQRGVTNDGYSDWAIRNSGGDLYFVWEGMSGESVKMFIDDDSGNVGIGTVGGLSKLSINGGLHVGGDSDAGDNNILADGTITGTQLVSNIAIGTSPLLITSTTLVSNLNADLWDGYQFADYLDQAVKVASSPTFAGLSITNGWSWTGDVKIADFTGGVKVINMTDNSSFALTFATDTNDDYLKFTTTNGSEKLHFGDTSLNQDYEFYGSGTMIIAGNTRIGSSAAPTCALDIAGDTKVSGLGTNPALTINQGGDKKGMKIYGYDDHSADYVESGVNSAGLGFFNSNLGFSVQHVGVPLAFIYDSTGFGLSIYQDKALSLGYYGNRFYWTKPSATNVLQLWQSVGADLQLSEINATGYEWHLGGLRLGDTTVPTEALEVNGTALVLNNIAVGTDSPSGGFSGEGDIYATSGIKAMEGLYSEAVYQGAGLEVSDNSLAITYTNAAYGDATFTAATQLLTDSHADFGGDDDVNVGDFLKIISSTPNLTGATGEIIGVPSSTTLIISVATSGDTVLGDVSGMSFVIYPRPNLFVGDNGDFHATVGVNADASFKVVASDSNNDHAVHYVITAGKDGNTGLNIEYDAHTYGGTAAMHLNYDATAFADADTIGTLLDAVVLNTGASDGNVHVMDVALGNPANADLGVAAVATHEGVDVIHQHLGEPAALDTAFSYTPSTYTDRTAAFNDSGTDVQIFVLEDDFILLGSSSKFDEINVLLNTTASHTIIPTFHFMIEADTWTAFTPADDSVGFSQNGTIRFNSDNLTGWAGKTIYEITGAGDNVADYYWIKITRTRKILPTPPTEDTIQVTTLGTELGWDKEGRLAIKTFSQANEPDTTDLPSGKFCFWTDTDDSKLYICYNHGGTIKTTELA